MAKKAAKKAAPKAGGGLKAIIARAQKIKEDGSKKKWTDIVKQASKELKAEKK